MIHFIICSSLFLAILAGDPDGDYLDTVVHQGKSWDFEVSPKTVCVVGFRGAYISVWEDANQPGRYYASPLVFLNATSAQTYDNIFSNDTELRFEVIMWSMEAHEMVIAHLKKHINQHVDEADLEILPMYKVRIAWNRDNRKLSNVYKVDNGWIPNSHLPHVAIFNIICSVLEDCQKLKELMLNKPISFENLELEYHVNGYHPLTRQVIILGEHVRGGALYTKLESMTQTTSPERYLTAHDMKTIISDTTHNVIASVQSDKNYVASTDEVSLTKLLEGLLEQKKVDSAQFDSEMWDSVFWDPDWARPDKLTSYLNEVLTKDERDGKLFVVNEASRSHHREGGGGASFFGFKIGGSSGSSSSSKNKIQIDEFMRHMSEKNYQVQFTGEIFRPKSVLLYRINLSKLSASTRIATTSIQMNKYETVQKARLRVNPPGHNDITLSPDLVEARLRHTVDQVKQDIKKDLKETKSDLKQQLTKTELELTKKVDDAKSEMENLDRGTTYIRWGRTVCPDTDTELVYHGYAGGNSHASKGGGANLICLTRQPENGNNPTPAQDTHAYIYGSEYQSPQSFFSDTNAPSKGHDALHDHDVPCAVCRTKTRPSKVMIPGRKSCDGDGWTREYFGYLMSGHWGHASLNFVCVDIAPEAVPGGHANHDGAILYIVQAHCGSLKCPPYKQNYEITCVVCTK